MTARWLYERSPVSVQNLFCTVAGQIRNWQRYDKGFAERQRYFLNASRWDLARAQEDQFQQLRVLYAYCREKVPHYREKLHGAAQIHSLAEFAAVSKLSKNDVREAGTSLISSDFEASRLVLSRSGGSTGMPLQCYHDRKALKDVYAFFWANQRPGVDRRDRYATFQGLDLVPRRQEAGPYWRMNHSMRQRLYSIFHLSEATIAEYIADLDQFRPVYFAGYANSLYLLAKLADEAGLQPKHFPQAVFSTSEQLLPDYRQTIERVFRTRVWDAYSQDETCGSITEYECGYYHYDRAYGYMEFDDVEVLPDNRRLAEIVCTGFLNRAWPLLRYRPGDLVEYEPADRCPECGRAGPLIHAIRGRTGDVIVLPSGRRFPHISLIVKNLRGVRQVQLVQQARDSIRIRFVPSEGFRPAADVEWMKRCFAEGVGERVQWSTEEVLEIPRTVSGKFMSIVSELESGPAGPVTVTRNRN